MSRDLKSKKHTPFTRRVLKFLKALPRGRVATYGQIAKLAGNPYGSRGVVWILNSSSKKYSLPWHRVVAAKGKIAFPRDSVQAHRQARRLQAEGVEVLNGKVDLLQFGWKKEKHRVG